MDIRQFLKLFWSSTKKNLVAIKSKQIVSCPIIKSYSTCTTGMKVTICGAAGRTGQPLALLLKQCPLLDEIALYDVSATCGMGMELSHVDTKCKVSSFAGKHMLCDALKGASIVVIVAREQEEDTFEQNAHLVTEIALETCNTCPDTFTIVATQPVESLVPLVSETKRLRSVYNPRKVLGCVELNCIRANTMLADFLRVPPETVQVPVVGGATPSTMVPVLSAAIHPSTLSQEQMESVTSSIMNGQPAVCKAKDCELATACLAGAYAIARNTINVLKGLKGRKNIVQCAYVDTMGAYAPSCQFLASDVILGLSGVEKSLGIPELSKFEKSLLNNCLPNVRTEIERGTCLVYEICQQCCLCPGKHPNLCLSTPSQPCVAPSNWTSQYPDSCWDEYLATICHALSCKCGSMDLCWRPKKSDYDAMRSSKMVHRIPALSVSSIPYEVPRSVRLKKTASTTNEL